MGLGKTLQIIALLLHHKQAQTAQAPSLLILPASLLSNWQAEITRFAPDLTVDYLHASYLSSDAMATLADSAHLNDLVINTYS
jgi:non-specific serine/threonine protein kinase